MLLFSSNSIISFLPFSEINDSKDQVPFEPTSELHTAENMVDSPCSKGDSVHVVRNSTPIKPTDTPTTPTEEKKQKAKPRKKLGEPNARKSSKEIEDEGTRKGAVTAKKSVKESKPRKTSKQQTQQEKQTKKSNTRRRSVEKNDKPVQKSASACSVQKKMINIEEVSTPHLTYV